MKHNTDFIREVTAHPELSSISTMTCQVHQSFQETYYKLYNTHTDSGQQTRFRGAGNHT